MTAQLHQTIVGEPRSADATPLRVCHIMSADLWAGAEAQLATAASYLVERSDVKLTAVLFNDGWLAHELKRIGVETAIVDEQRHNALQILMFLRRFLREHDVDLVHTHRAKDTVLGSAAARLAGVRHIVRTVHGLAEPMRGWRRAKYIVYDAVDKLALWACADRIVAVSHRTAEVLKHSGYKRRAVRPIHNGVDFRSVRSTQPAAAVRRALGVDAGALFIGTAGRLAPVKGHEYFVDAAARIVNEVAGARVVFIGSGSREPELRARARALGVESACLFVHPAVDRPADVYDLIAALDIFVLPSLSEGIPMALLEAMALGKPCVASAVGGVPEIITDRATGLLVAPRNADALASACVELARNRAWALMLGVRGRRSVETGFSRERNGRALVDLYCELANHANRSRPARGVALGATPSRLLVARIRAKVAHAIERRRAEGLRHDRGALAAALADARHVLVVCHGNIIRSPFAARLIGDALGRRSPVLVASAGLEAEPGRAAHPLAVAAAAPLRIDLRDHTACRLTAESVARADAIFVMDVPQLVAIRRMYPGARRKTFLLTCLAADTPLEVFDPVDADAPLFHACYDHISRAVRPLAEALAGGIR